MTAHGQAAERDGRAEYEAAWTQAGGRIEKCVRDGMTDPAEIMRAVTRSEVRDFLGRAAFRDYCRAASANAAEQRLGVASGAYALLPFEFRNPETLDTLAAFVRGHADLDAIVELGSGTGRNLFMLAERLRRDGIRLPAFHACEYTEAGRQATLRLDAIGGGGRVAVHAFDYRRPDLSFLDGSQNVLFYSVHSLEQVTTVDDRFIGEMIARAAACHCLHFEPVGWQLDPALVAWRDAYDKSGAARGDSVWWKAGRLVDRALGTALAPGFSFIPMRDVQVGASDKTSLNSARWSARFRYNKNLVEVLRRVQTEGRIEIFREEPEVFAQNPFVPTTIIGWSKRR